MKIKQDDAIKISLNTNDSEVTEAKGFEYPLKVCLVVKSNSVYLKNMPDGVHSAKQHD